MKRMAAIALAAVAGTAAAQDSHIFMSEEPRLWFAYPAGWVTIDTRGSQSTLLRVADDRDFNPVCQVDSVPEGFHGNISEVGVDNYNAIHHSRLELREQISGIYNLAEWDRHWRGVIDGRYEAGFLITSGWHVDDVQGEHFIILASTVIEGWFLTASCVQYLELATSDNHQEIFAAFALIHRSLRVLE